MSGGYLWDPGQPEDADVREWERSLQGYAYKPDPGKLRGFQPRFHRKWLAAAASIVAVTAITLVWSSRAPSNGWRFQALQGTVRAGGRMLTEGALNPGQRLETARDSRARIEVESLGSVEVEPGTSIRLVRSSARERRMALDRGVIRAVISAPPRVFVVDTPSAVATDLGCAYKLEVDERGDGFLRVTVGWVSFEAQGRESFIPAGAACHTRKGFAPGTPYYQDAADALQQALTTVDFSPDPQERAAALSAVLREARARDRLTLWHLLTRGSAADRAATFGRFAQLAPLPDGVTFDGVLSMDRQMLDKLWVSLDLGPADWWRQWKGPAPPAP